MTDILERARKKRNYVVLDKEGKDVEDIYSYGEYYKFKVYAKPMSSKAWRLAGIDADPNWLAHFETAIEALGLAGKSWDETLEEVCRTWRI